MVSIFPTRQEAERLAQQPGVCRIPVAMTVPSDKYTPVLLLEKAISWGKPCFLLENVEGGERWGRYSFLGFCPTARYTCRQGRITITNSNGITEEKIQAPNDFLRELLAQHKSPAVEGLPPSAGGLVGSFSFEYFAYLEPEVGQAENTECWDDFDLLLFEQIIAFDHQKQRLVLICHIPADDVAQTYPMGQKALEELKNFLDAPAGQAEPLHLTGPFVSQFTKEGYEQMVEKSKQYIREGEIFQVVPANRKKAPFTGSLFDVYRVLRMTNPSPYLFYLNTGGLELAGASPETLVKKRDRQVYTFPLAGSRPRGRTKEEDLALEKELLSDEKELAEHNMLVDLGRNDLGRVCTMGSVQVQDYLSIARYSHIMHIGSTVSGVLREDCDALDALSSILPAGTLSGAPKIRACQIIGELEQQKRGVYGGAIGYLDFSGNMDTCIAIRLAYAKDHHVFTCAGAGIVADSVPEREYAETEQKQKAVLEAIRLAEGGLR